MGKHSKNGFKLLVIMVVAVSFSSCISSRTLKKYVKTALPYNAEEIVNKQLAMTDYTLICTDSVNYTDSVVAIKKTKGYFIPAILFWTWDSTFETNINKNIYLQTLTSTFEERAIEFELKKHLEGRKLVVTVERLPSSFYYSSNGWFVFLLYSYSYSFGENIKPNDQKFRVRYKVLQDGTEVVNDMYERSFVTTSTNNFSATDKFIANYLDETKLNFKKACEELFDRIVENL